MICFLRGNVTIGTTGFFGFAVLWHFNPLSAGEMLEFSKTKWSFQLVGVVMVHAVISLCNAVLKLV